MIKWMKDLFADKEFKAQTLGILKAIMHKLKELQMTIDELKVQVAENTQVEASAVVLITGLAARIEASLNDPAKLQELADEMKASASTLAGAVAANTALVPPVPEPPTPEPVPDAPTT